MCMCLVIFFFASLLRQSICAIYHPSGKHGLLSSRLGPSTAYVRSFIPLLVRIGAINWYSRQHSVGCRYVFGLNVFMIEFVSSFSLIFYLRFEADEYVWYIPVRVCSTEWHKWFHYNNRSCWKCWLGTLCNFLIHSLITSCAVFFCSVRKKKQWDSTESCDESNEK